MKWYFIYLYRYFKDDRSEKEAENVDWLLRVSDNKRLLKLLECDSNIIVSQVTDGKLSKTVIEHFNKDLLKLLDKSKNNADPHWFWQ